METPKKRFEMEWDGRTYFLSAGRFYDAQTFLKPPEVVQQHLKAAYSQRPWT
jgi:hypothetical protein